MIGVSFLELVLIAIILLLFFDEEKFPKLLRDLGSIILRLRRTVTDAQHEVSSVMKQTIKGGNDLLEPISKPLKEVEKITSKSILPKKSTQKKKIPITSIKKHPAKKIRARSKGNKKAE